jgi:hypothetical protein
MKHCKAIIYKERLEPEIWNNSFKFCLVRNPFDLMVSSYNWWLQKAGKFPKLAERAKLVSQLGSFADFIEHDLGARHINEHLGEPEHWFLDRSGRDLMDFIVKLEAIDDLPRILSRYTALPPNIKIEHLNSTKRENYQTYYNDEARESVSRRFRYTIDRFGYRF